MCQNLLDIQLLCGLTLIIYLVVMCCRFFVSHKTIGVECVLVSSHNGMVATIVPVHGNSCGKRGGSNHILMIKF